MVDALRHGAPVDQSEGAGGPAGHDLQLPADGILHPPGDMYQLAQILRRGLDGAVAPQVHAYACQLHMGQVPLHMDAHVQHLVLVPEALPQVAQVRHDHGLVDSSLPGAGLLQGVQRGPLALQRIVTPPGHVVQLAQHGDPQQHIRPRHSCLAAADDLLQPAAGQLGGPAVPEQLPDLRQAAASLDNAAHLDALGGAAGDDLLHIVPQTAAADLQTGELPVHTRGPRFQ